MEPKRTGKDIAEFVGITKATDPPRLLLESPTLSVLLPSYDFVKADFGEETGGEIHLEYRRHLVVLTGQNLSKLFRAFHVNEVAVVTETQDTPNPKPADCLVSRIVVAPLSDEKPENNPDSDD